jgi:hypothetical protein
VCRPSSGNIATAAEARGRGTGGPAPANLVAEWLGFTLPGQWVSPSGPPRWKRIVAVDSAFQFQPPQEVAFQGAGLEFSIGALNRENRENWSIGFCQADGFDAWRGHP